MGVPLTISSPEQQARLKEKLREYQDRGGSLHFAKIEILKILVSDQEVSRDDSRLWGIDSRRLQVAWNSIAEMVEQTKNSNEGT